MDANPEVEANDANPEVWALLVFLVPTSLNDGLGVDQRVEVGVQYGSQLEMLDVPMNWSVSGNDSNKGFHSDQYTHSSQREGYSDYFVK